MESHLEYRDNIRKTLGASVSTDVFLDPAFAHVSAFLFDEGSWVGQPRHPSIDFKILHNPNALSPLPDGWYPAGDEYWWRDDFSIERRRNGG